MSDKAVFNKLAPYNYSIPNYRVVDGKGIRLEKDLPLDEVSPGTTRIVFLRGSKVEDENVLPKLDGVLPEQLIAVCIDHIEAVNTGNFKCSENDAVLDSLKEAGLWLLKRETNRRKANVLGTYQK